MLAVRSYAKHVLFLILIGSFSTAFAGSKVIEGKVPGSTVPVKFTYMQTGKFVYLTPVSESQICEKPKPTQPEQETIALPGNDPILKLNKKLIADKGNCLISIVVKQDQLEDAIAYLLNLDVPTSASNLMIGMLHACRQDLAIGD